MNVYGNVREYSSDLDVFGNVFIAVDIIIVSVYVAEMDVFTSHTQAIDTFLPGGEFGSHDGILEMQVI
jgi:hypothetical protein